MEKKRRFRWLPIAVLFFAGVAALYFWFRERPHTSERLQGSWTSREGGHRTQLFISRDLMVLDIEGFSEPRRTYYRLDRAANPKRIIAWSADDPSIRQPATILERLFGSGYGPRPDQEIRGIYELDGDQLRIRMEPPGENFPATFDVESGVLLDLRRE